jgi:hypothetical protein
LGAIEAEKLSVNVPGIANPIYVNVGGDVIPGLTITGIPYADDGNTCEYAHNYNAVCPYTNDGAPDVVYNFTPLADVVVDVDLCGAAYDSKAYVMTANQEVICCNDDANCGLNGYGSFVQCCELAAGTTYYIVVDGWSSVDCGTYHLLFNECVTCYANCPPGGYLENEPICGDNYVDTTNGGCFSDPPVFSAIPCDPDGEAVTVCGDYGGYLYFGQNYRDTDWYEIYLEHPGEVTWCVTGEYWTLLAIIDGNGGCPILNFYDYEFTVPCVEACVSTNLVSGYWWFFVATWDFGPNAGDCGLGDYNATITGHFCPVVSVEAKSWGSIKNLYR